MKRQGIDIDEKLLVRGFSDGVSGVTGLLNNRQLGRVFQELQKQMLAEAAARRKKETEKKKKANAAFLAKNGKRDGVKTLKSGLQYLVIRKGKGKKPKATDTVVTHYRGKLIDGTEFDNSIKRGQPSIFSVNGVIKGWIEALQLMKVGAKWKLFIPSDLAYGPQGSLTGSIGPNEVLIFDLELIAIKAPPKKKPKGKSKPKAAKKSPRR
ncbi:MAG: FKBP-type peptidyl-prolyl cis-trans isomerase [Planctomycetes bacterium]|nr:FKBP-type peptidyl-prolyl cis-trans isomerase [Planctomycetota bacterium]